MPLLPPLPGLCQWRQVKWSSPKFAVCALWKGNPWDCAALRASELAKKFIDFPWYKKTQTNFLANPIPERVCNVGVWHQTTETRALPVRWHQTAGAKVPQVLVGHSAPQALALRACDESGSLVLGVAAWFSLNPLWDHSSLSWRVVTGF